MPIRASRVKPKARDTDAEQSARRRLLLLERRPPRQIASLSAKNLLMP